MADQFLGEIHCFPYNFAPRGWAVCNGQLLLISQNTALFSLLGTYYGGDGRTTFALPNLQGCVPLGFGQGPGLSNYDIGEISGVESVTINVNEMAAHSHLLAGTSAAANDKRPLSGSAFAQTTGPGPVTPGDNYYAVPTGLTPLGAGTIAPYGGGQPHTNLQPYLVLNFCIALQGIFPARN